MKSPKKIYFIDNAIINKIGFNATDNLGSLLENIVCVELLRQGKEIYYHADTQECDFIVREGNQIVQSFQVTVSLNDPRTREREMKGALSAMDAYKLKEGYIITLEEYEEVTIDDGRCIHVLPVWKWLLEKH